MAFDPFGFIIADASDKIIMVLDPSNRD